MCYGNARSKVVENHIRGREKPGTREGVQRGSKNASQLRLSWGGSVDETGRRSCPHGSTWILQSMHNFSKFTMLICCFGWGNYNLSE
jgi:hypothetical protein